MKRMNGTLIAVISIPLMLLMLATAYIAYTSAQDLEVSRTLIGNTNEVLGEIQNVWSLTQDAESSQRGFMITGNDAYLKPFQDAEAKIPAVLSALSQNLKGNTSQAQRLESLNGYLKVKFAEMNQIIEIRKARGFEQAQLIVMNNSGQAAMNSIRVLASDMTVAERTLLDEHLSGARVAENETFLVTATFFGILLMLGLGGGYLFYRNFERLTRTERELDSKAGLLQTTLDTVAEGIGAFDAEGRLIARNRHFFELLELSPVLSTSKATLDHLLQNDAPDKLLSQAVRIAAEDNRPGYAQYESRSGRIVEVFRSLMGIGGFVLSVRDITEGRNAENALRHAQKMETVGQLTGGVAHDFNNLLQIIMANLDLALRHAPEGALQKRLKDAMVGAERGSKLTRQLLAFARRQPLKPEPVNLSRLVRDLTELLRRTLGEAIAIEETVAAGLWIAQADRSQVENAIVNLAINARDAMPDGGRLTIELGNAYLDDSYARLHEDVRPGQYVVIAVTDTGSGMPADVVARAFDPFFSTKAEGKGTGLGLSMVYGFTKQSGGHAKIYSEVGIGTTVKLYLPRSMQIESPLFMQGGNAAGGSGEVILVVEDEAQVREAVISMLDDLGYRTIEAENGTDALEKLKQQGRIDLMFTDVVMPGEIQGRRLAQEALAIRPALPIVFTSGYTENSIIHHGRLDDGVHLLSKPYRKEDLARKIRNVLGPVPGQEKWVQAAHKPEAAKELPSQNDDEIENAISTSPNGHVYRIVFAEDDTLVRMSTIDMLESFGHTVYGAMDADTALDFLRLENPDVLFVDINLGGSDGRALALKARQIKPDIRIVFASGRDAGDVKDLPDDAQFLAKPYGMPELRRALDSLVS